MGEINYVGETLWPGQLGHFSIVLSFVAALTAAAGYFFATRYRNDVSHRNWLLIGRTAFFIHAAALFTIVLTFFFILTNNYYEYQYVWANTSDDLPFEYVFSAFWKDQEGSFILWKFWHVVLGLVLIWKAGRWEAPVMAQIALIQVFIASMILGIYIGGGDNPLKLGSNPFLLLRDVMDAPIFAKADYLSQIKGNGLNPLLQNYWMTIHPPTLFLGFASTAVPMAYAVAGIWTRQYQEWIKPVMPWALFSGAILGLGILMGGAWAYEALTFGGYWAWDPVENMSLVPWLVLIAGIHTNLIARSTGHSIRTTYIFYFLSFALVLYSTFLTRSGVLGDTSVHAFTELGLENQLLAFILVFLLIGIGAFIRHYRAIPSPNKEEPTASREFWMFIGTLVLLFSSAIITVSTSLPVYNKIRSFFDPDFVGRVINDPIEHYNKFQLWIAVFLGFLSGTAQYLRYREQNWKKKFPVFLRQVLIALVLAVLLTFLASFWIRVSSWQYLLLMLAAWFTVFCNLGYSYNYLRNNLRSAGSAFSHIGFGLMIIGVMASGLNKEHISTNTFTMEGLLPEDRLSQNIILYEGAPMFMNGYEVEYTHDTLIGHTRYYYVDYRKLDEEGNVIESFTLQPDVLYDNQFTKIAAVNPSTRRYLDKDIFTHIASLPASEISMEEAKAMEDSLRYEEYEAAIGDTVYTFDHFVVVEGVNKDPDHPDYIREEGDIALGLKLAFRRPEIDSVWYAEPVQVLRDQMVYTYSVRLDELGVKTRLSEEVFERVFPVEESLDYEEFVFSRNQEVRWNGLGITFAGFDKSPSLPAYQPSEGDIAVGAIIRVDRDSLQKEAAPVYLIRGNQTFNIKDEITDWGLHFRFTDINPVAETITLQIAKEDDSKELRIPFEIAENAPRTDYIVLEAIVFPGINLFWLGSLMMLFGLGMAMWNRIMGAGKRH